MGQGESQPTEPFTPPDDKHRKQLLRKLGIESHYVRPPPVVQQEAPDRLERIYTTPPAGEKAEKATQGDFEMNILDLRSKDDFRVNYLKKLSYNQVWVPNARKAPRHQTVIIFDWDDTLLCTSYLNLRGDESHPNTRKQLDNIANIGRHLLELAMRLGHVFIITNAMSGWVEYSSQKYIPSIKQLLDNGIGGKKIKIISARGNYEHRFPGQYQEWKIQAFLEVQRELNAEIITNLISLGDSNIEMDAVHIMGKEFSQALIKTIKFRENPSPDELAKQLELVAQKFEKICLNARNLKIGLERKWVHPNRPKPGTEGAAAPNQPNATAAEGEEQPGSQPSTTPSPVPVPPPLPDNSAPPPEAAAHSQLGNLGIHNAFAAAQQQEGQESGGGVGVGVGPMVNGIKGAAPADGGGGGGGGGKEAGS
ncbi:unnamed protein product [Vitrella brassicaformis CCMP3155]|uniref:Uncharacterized protein n=2 Tax=Vitrella brassicaformis TaxID=1169539 RepID=A0A0G4FNX7_VITBC|nr:unnamed protein product [Vitrella brassicaformis CCMP3155]|eukprot:CEM15895.1 unnamed protein product [Vitrella brassicaformis CCMP3155]